MFPWQTNSTLFIVAKLALFEGFPALLAPFPLLNFPPPYSTNRPIARINDGFAPQRRSKILAAHSPLQFRFARSVTMPLAALFTADPTKSRPKDLRRHTVHSPSQRTFRCNSVFKDGANKCILDKNDINLTAITGASLKTTDSFSWRKSP